MIYDVGHAFYNNFCGWMIGKNAYTVLYWIYCFWHQSNSTLHIGICINWDVQSKLSCSSLKGSVCIPDFTPFHRSTEAFFLVSKVISRHVDFEISHKFLWHMILSVIFFYSAFANTQISYFLLQGKNWSMYWSSLFVILVLGESFWRH